MEAESHIQNVSIENIIPNRFQPRLTFDEDALNALAESIKEHGIIQPLIVRKVGDKFEIIAGERRYKASTIAGLTEVPVIIANLDDNNSAEVALVENVQRKNLSSIEEAKSYKKILDKGYLTQERLAQKLGISQPAVANKLRLLALTDEVQEALINDKISERHARSLLQITDSEAQKNMLDKVIKERLTVRQLDDEIKKVNDPILEKNETIEDNIIPNEIEPLSNNESNIDINPIEERDTAQDIIPSSSNLFNIFSKKEYPSLEDEAVNLNTSTDDIFNPFLKREDFSLDIPVEENIELPKKDNTPAPIEENSIDINNIQTVKDAYKELKEKVAAAGYNIVSEDFDFDDLYQIIIKIDKQAD